MTLRIVQHSEYVPTDYWNWSVWLEGPSEELDRVQWVKWFLHPTFEPSIVPSEDRRSGFRLDSSGWGTFVIRATVRRTDGKETKLRHSLELYYPDGEGPARSKEEIAMSSRAPSRSGSPPHGRKQIFLSYGSEDREAAERVRKAIESLGVDIRIVDQSNLPDGVPSQNAVRNMLRDSDGVVAVVSSEIPSSFLVDEVSTAVDAGKPTLILGEEGSGRIHGLPADLEVVKVRRGDRGGMADTLERWVAQMRADL